ncbi:unnamed protein product [Adineta ricciae]|uniref:Reverse transcriptase domain-containing protein n=1 Tax=Adineta ricciae TaxID=249248 RepID=A0A815U1R3_ADIRI|nr:unnamed protein product [Adineta ricciae]
MDTNDTNRQGDQPLAQQQLPRKKCHGNRQDQRFRRKCRKRGMKPKKIKKLLKERKRGKKTKTQNKNNPQVELLNQEFTDTNSNTPLLTTTTTTIGNLNKRKRDISVQDFQTHSTATVPKSNTELNKYQTELNTQKQSCPIVDLSMDQIDQCLKQFIDSQRQYLLTRKKNELKKFKDHISTNEIIQSVSIQHQLTVVQNEFLQQAMIIRQQELKIWEEILMFEIRISCKFLPLNFYQMETFIVPLSYIPVIKEQKVIEFNNKQYKIIQEGKRNWLDIFLHTYEIKLQQYEQQYENIFQQFQGPQQLSTGQITTMDDSSDLMNKTQEYINNQTNKLKEDISQKMAFFRRKLLTYRQSSSTSKDTVGVSPESYLALYENPFNTCQWNQLSLGPSFIRLNQTACRPQDQQKIEIENQYKDITQKVRKHLTSYPHLVPFTSPYFKQYEHHLRIYLNHCYFAPVPYKDQMQSLEQLHIATTIRKTIKQNKLILRRTDNGHNFYIGSANEYEKKVQNFFQDTKAFEELPENPLDQIVDKAIELLNHLRQKGHISKQQYDEMVPDRTETELPHLYFNPKTHKDGIPVRPIENKRIRPIFNEICQPTNITDGNSFLNEMFKYTKKGLLKPTTLFCIFDIRNLYTMLPQDEALNILIDFLYTHGYRNVQGISLDTIRKLASFVIKENVCAYSKKIYRQIIGGAMGSSFTLTLANIFMWKWQKDIVRQQDVTCEFYGRYIDDVFMTWNRSEEDLINLLDQANTWHLNIKLDYKIGKTVPFLDILLTNNNGILSTSVYHKPAAEPYVVPFQSDHPRHIFVNIIQNSLKHALKYSSTFEAFSHERRYIKLMLLYNGYPSSLIENQFRKFFHEHISSTSLLSFIINEKQFHVMRQTIQPNANTSDILNILTIDNQQNTITTATTTTTMAPSNNEDKTSDKKMIKHYLFILYMKSVFNL